MKLLDRMFPSMRPQIVVRVEDEPEWNADDAARLRHFLIGATGQKLLTMMRCNVVAAMLDPNITEENRLLARAGAQLIEGLESSADTNYWAAHQQDTRSEEQAYRYLAEEHAEQ